MGLTNEDLDNIKLPLSDEDYKMLRKEDARTGYKMWSLASPELREAFDKKEAERVYKKHQIKNGGGRARGAVRYLLDMLNEIEDEEKKK